VVFCYLHRAVYEYSVRKALSPNIERLLYRALKGTDPDAGEHLSVANLAQVAAVCCTNLCARIRTERPATRNVQYFP
jgi:hypothetical protein